MSDSTRRLPARPSTEQLRKQAKELLREFRAGKPEAVARVCAVLPQRVDRPDNVPLAAAQFVLAREYGFENWANLVELVSQPPADPRNAPHGLSSSPPFYRVDWNANTIEPHRPVSDQDWETIFAVMKDHRITGLNAAGQMTDAAMEHLSRLDEVSRLDLNGSKLLTDDGLEHLARMPQLQELDLSEYPGGSITDRGLESLRHLTGLKRFQMCWQSGISDAGIANLAFCENLESVNLLGTPTGDGSLRALAGKARLTHLKTGKLVTDAGLLMLHQFPAFQAWRGGDARYGLMSFDSEPTHLLIDGSFTNAGLASLAGLDGIFGLSFFWHVSEMTPDGLGALSALPNLGFLGCQGALCNDEAMCHIASLPQLRMLMGQGTVAGDEGWTALSRSQTIEYVWGRECPNLTSRGFAALAGMPALRGLAVSCKNVDDAALSALPRFPALRALMPMDVSDDGFRHVGCCERLEELWCMYCRDTSDVATGHIAGLSRLKSYYAGLTQITDNSLEILARMSALERIEFHHCAGLSDAGIAHLAGLPRLAELIIAGSPKVTRGAIAKFPSRVRVNYGP